MNSDQNQPTMKQIDYTPLTSPVGWREALAPEGSSFVVVSGTSAAINATFALLLVIPLTVMFFLLDDWTMRFMVVAFVALIVLSVAMMVSAQMKFNRKMVRVRRFAEANGLRFLPRNNKPPYKGIIFNVAGSTDCIANNIVYSTTSHAPQSLEFEVGSYLYTVGSGKSSTRYGWTYIRIKLDRNLPHMVLDAKANNHRLFGADLGTNLPVAFTKDQILHLEGNFDEYFTLYAPREYEDDALYVFTPDVMAMLIDESSQFDAEVIDNEIYFYTEGAGADVSDPAFMQRLMAIVTTLGSKIDAQTEHYSDDHVIAQVSANTVGSGGRQLRTTPLTWAAVAGVVGLIAYVVLSMLISLRR